MRRPAATSAPARDRRGIAAVEFAILAPVMLVLLGSLIDYSLALWYKGTLAGSVAQGAEYAFLVGPTASAANVKAVVQHALVLPAAAVTITTPIYYCVNGRPAVATVQPATATCANNEKPGTYLKISATYTYTSMMPVSSGLLNPVLTETATIRLR